MPFHRQLQRPHLVVSACRNKPAIAMDAGGSVALGGGWRIGGSVQGAAGNNTDWIVATGTITFAF